MSAKKKSVKNEYAPLFRIIYWSIIGFFFAAVAWMALDGFLSASNGIQKYNRMSQEIREVVEREQSNQTSKPTSIKSNDNSDEVSEKSDESSEQSDQSEQTGDNAIDTSENKTEPS